MSDNETALSLQLSLALAVAGSWSAGASLDFDSVPAPQVQPKKRAFAIWGLLFPSLGALVSYGGKQDVLPDSSVHALIGALAGTIAWASLVRRRQYGAAAVLLTASAASAFLAFLRLPLTLSPRTPTLLPRMTLGMYAGWLVVASMIMAAVARPTLFDRPNVVAAVALVFGVAVLLGRGQPYPLFSILWALFHRNV